MTPNEKIEALAIGYQKDLPKKFIEIESLLNEGIQTGFTAESFASFYRLIHNFIGSGATFGLNDISSMSRAIEKEIKPFVHNKTIPSAVEIEALLSLVDDLGEACNSYSDSF